MKHLRYLSYVLRHKWFVALECARVGLYWRGLVHDWHKLLPSEWFPYTEYFYGARGGSIAKGRDDTGDAAFDFAWLLHQKRADHHWQWWILPEDDGGEKLMAMSPEARLEMVCDWCGASRAQGHGGWAGVAKWYTKNYHKMRLAPETRAWVERHLAARMPPAPNAEGADGQ